MVSAKGVSGINILHSGTTRPFVVRGFIVVIEFKRSVPTKAMRECKGALYCIPIPLAGIMEDNCAVFHSFHSISKIENCTI